MGNVVEAAREIGMPACLTIVTLNRTGAVIDQEMRCVLLLLPSCLPCHCLFSAAHSFLRCCWHAVLSVARTATKAQPGQGSTRRWCLD